MALDGGLRGVFARVVMEIYEAPGLKVAQGCDVHDQQQHYNPLMKGWWRR